MICSNAVLDALRTETHDVVSSFGTQSVAAFEYRRLALNYMLASCADDKPEILSAISELSYAFNGTRRIRVTKPSESSQNNRECISPISLVNSKAYEAQYISITDDIETALTFRCSPLHQYPYIVSENLDFIWCTIASNPSETITKRSVADGRIVHPSIAYPCNYKVLLAGEFSQIVNRENSEKFVIATSCSGHYRPSHITAEQMMSILYSSIAEDLEKINVICISSNDCGINNKASRYLRIKNES